MCGGLASALGLQKSGHNYILSYHLGRITSYSLAGLIVGLIGFWFSEYLGALKLLSYFAAAMLILMGLYLAGWFNGLIFSEKLGAILWKRLQPLGRRYLQPQSQLEAIALGAVWGWLPCGLVYSGLIYASTQAHWASSALTMLCFGLGTLPAMLSTSFAGVGISKWLNNQTFKMVAGICLIAYGIWLIAQVSGLLTHH